MNWKNVLLVLGLVLAVGETGCSTVEVVDSDRGMAYQNKDAATQMLADPACPPTFVQPLKDIAANSNQQMENWGDPKDKAATYKKYTALASQEQREQSKEEHKEQSDSKRWWVIGGGILLTFGSWLMRSYGLGWIPVIGTMIAHKSPRLANGAFANETIALGLQTAMDKARDYFDKQAAAFKAKMASGKAGEFIDVSEFIPTGEKLVELVKNEMNKRGVMPQNTRLYDKNDTGVV